MDEKDTLRTTDSTGIRGSRHLRWSQVFASLVAFYQHRDELRVPDLIAGIYIANFERVVRFWPRPDMLEDFVAIECGWSEPRWRTWQRWDHEVSRARRGRRNVNNLQFIDHIFHPSKEWKKLFEIAARLTPLTIQDGNRELPFFTPEVVLLACTYTEGLPFADSFRRSGVLADELEKSVKNINATPDQLQF